MDPEKVKYAELLPAEFMIRLQQKALAYLPLGTLEWHGVHLPLGADAIQSEALMMECAKRFGGIVLPPIFLGPDRRMETETGNYLVGMDFAQTTQPRQMLPGSAYWVSPGFFLSILDSLLEQLKRAGFKAVFADGHGPSRRIWVESIERNEKKFGLKLEGVTPDLKSSWPFMVDHAAENETSIMMNIRPDLVDLSIYPEGELSPVKGVNGAHPFKASANAGKEYIEKAIALLAPKLNKI